MAAPAPQNGNLVGTISSSVSAATFTGTASSSDYVVTSNPNNYAIFSDFVLRGNSLVYTWLDPFANTFSTFTLPNLGTSTSIEYISKDVGSSASTGIYSIVSPGDYRTNTTYTNIQSYGTNANDVVYGLVGSNQNNALSGGAGDDLLAGGAGVNILSGGSGSNTLIGGAGSNRYKIEVADKGVNTVIANGSNNIVQVLLTSTSFDWNIERVGNDSVGWISDIDGNKTDFVIKNQFTTNPIDGIVVYASGYSTNGSAFAGIGFLDPGVGAYPGTSQGFIGDLNNNNFDLRSTTRSTVHVFGNDGNDTLYAAPLAVREFFHGGTGIDKIIYSEALNKFTVAVTNNVTVASSGRVVDYSTIKHASKANPDALTNVERIKFSDTNVALDVGPTQNAGSVYMIYKAAFNRAPDASGMGYWLAQKDNGSNIVTNIAQGFVNSAEFTAKYGTNPSNATYIDKLYQNVLGRSGDAGGVAYWNQQLDNGSVSKAAALAAFATLPEGASNVASLIANGIPYTEFVG